MDSLTHIALGACIGEAFLGRKMGKKALLWGALAQSIPDLDFIASLWMHPADALLAHRGFTHSIVFVLIMIPLLSMLFRRIYPNYPVTYLRTIAFFSVELFLHIFIDAFNNYGVGWFEPFSHYRISFNAIYVVDPLFSLWPGIAFIMLLILPLRHMARNFWWRFGIYLSALYLVYCVENKITIDKTVKEIAARYQLNSSNYMATPTPMNNWLWFIILKDDHGYEVGYRSIFDTKPYIEFTHFERGDSILQPYLANETTQKLIRFSKGFYSGERWGDTVVFNDLRFGQEAGWYHPRGRFVFHYYLTRSTANRMTLQRGRFEFWSWAAFKALISRIKGN